MKKIILTIIGIVILVSGGYFVYQNFNKQEENILMINNQQKTEKKKKIVKQNFVLTGYQISLQYDDKKWKLEQDDGETAFGDYVSYIYLGNIVDKEIYIKIGYIKNIRTPQQKEAETEDTGGPATYPPIIEDLTDEFEFVRELEGYKMYTEKKNDDQYLIYQEIKKGKIVYDMPLLNKKNNIPTEEEKFSIEIYSGKDDLNNELKQEFIDIVKSIKIEKIEK